MATRDRRIDEYIAKSAPFARPILTQIREVVHTAVPGVEEDMKWSFPHFMYKGMLCSMASFKQHCAFGFWKGSLLKANGSSKSDGSMGQFGRITSVADLPSKAALVKLVKEAARLNDDGVKVEKKPAKRAQEPVAVPDDLMVALRTSKRAQGGFEALTPSHRREYVEWITGAKADATRARRLATALESLSAGKSLNWKYERKA
jgi:uncharacterized protein YdeI (YjbR/CyaY-like superfamily)